jgi:hypothetical protein
MAGFEVTFYGRIWVTPKGESYRTKRTFWSNKCDEMPRNTSTLVVGSRVAHAKPLSQVFA